MKDIVFQQFLKPISKHLIEAGTERFQSDYHCKHFSTFDHLKVLIDAHLNGIKSLRTLETALADQRIGITSPIKRSTLSDANTKRTAGCFTWLLEQLLS